MVSARPSQSSKEPPPCPSPLISACWKFRPAPRAHLPRADQVRRPRGHRRRDAGRDRRRRNPRRPPAPRAGLDADGQRLGLAHAEPDRAAPSWRPWSTWASGWRRRPIGIAARAIRWRSRTSWPRIMRRLADEVTRATASADPMPRLAAIGGGQPAGSGHSRRLRQSAGAEFVQRAGAGVRQPRSGALSYGRIRRRISRPLHAAHAQAADAAVSSGRRARSADPADIKQAGQRRPAGNARRVDRAPTG